MRVNKRFQTTNLYQSSSGKLEQDSRDVVNEESSIQNADPESKAQVTNGSKVGWYKETVVTMSRCGLSTPAAWFL